MQPCNFIGRQGFPFHVHVQALPLFAGLSGLSSPSFLDPCRSGKPCSFPFQIFQIWIYRPLESWWVEGFAGIFMGMVCFGPFWGIDLHGQADLSGCDLRSPITLCTRVCRGQSFSLRCMLPLMDPEIHQTSD